MTSLESLLINFSETHRIIAYAIIFLTVLIEGEIIVLLAGVLTKSGYLSFLNIALIAFVAASFHDLIWWTIGRKLADAKRKKFLCFDFEKIGHFLTKIRLNSGIYIFLSKFAWNFNRLALVTSGYAKTPIKKMLSFSVPACFIWAFLFVALGNVFADQTDILKKDLKTAGLFVVGLIVGILILENVIRKIIGSLNGNKESAKDCSQI